MAATFTGVPKAQVYANGYDIVPKLNTKYNYTHSNYDDPNFVND
jgi:hypothetical protein